MMQPQPGFQHEAQEPSLVDDLIGRTLASFFSLRTGFGLIALGFVLGVWNLINSIRPLAAMGETGRSLLDIYFQVDHPINAVQAYGSVLAIILGIVVIVIGATRRRVK